MKVKPDYIKWITLFTFFFIIFNQIIWIYNMYNAYVQEFNEAINKSLENALDKELIERQETLGDFFYKNLAQSSDEEGYIKRTYVTADTTFHVRIHKHDTKSQNKLTQFFLQYNYPLKLEKLDSIFQEEIKTTKFTLKDISFEYINLATEEILDSYPKENNFTKPVPDRFIKLDILESIGLKMYMKDPGSSVVKSMAYQLSLSILLITIGILGLLYLMRTIYAQFKEEKMRQSSINAMTHEFKRPISGAVTQTSLISYYLDKEDYQKARKYAQGSLLELNKLTAYTERIQRISNNEKGNIVLDKTSVEMIPFFDSLKNKYEGEVKGKLIALDYQVHTERETIYVDLLHFSNVMDNLIENAIKYSGKEVRIEVTVEDRKNDIVLHVKDNGFGISKIDIKYIFDRFYRSNAKEAKSKTGFGLGLTYVKAIVEAHGGKIEVRSELGEGSEFIIYLPQNNNEVKTDV
ncbi:MAG: HAMP domain-containing histidine kinase [Candidatus Azobacteroides sp.]|nr:HAMP domain-containing histidine kinase [Candidatus Azobacteroides sp.]